VSGTWRHVDGHSGTVRQLPQQYYCLSTHGREVPCRPDTRSCSPALDAALVCSGSVPDTAVGRVPDAWSVAVVIAALTTTCPLVVRVRLSPGHLSGASDHRHRHQLGKECRTAAVRTELPEAADGQSADRSGPLQLPLLFLKAGPAGGRLRRPSSAGNATHHPVTRYAGWRTMPTKDADGRAYHAGSRRAFPCCTGRPV
jgi:hypothetical protein